MPYKDSKKHRDYYRDYMRRRRAGQAAAKPKPGVTDGASAKLEARIRELEAELAVATLKQRLEEAQARPAAAPSGGTNWSARIRELEAELAVATLKRRLEEAQARPAAAPSGGTNWSARIRELEAENARLKAELASERSRAASKPKPAKPPLPPDEARERTIKGLRTRIRNLEAAVGAMVMKANMPRATQNTIAKVLHPDTRKHLTRKELDTGLDEACRLFTAWKADKDGAARKAKE